LVLAGFGAPIYVDRDLAFRDPINHLALAYWRSKGGAHGMPSRARLDPVEMRGFVANVGLVDVLAPAGGQRTFRIRLAGTAVEDVFGHLTGRMLAELPDYIRPRWHNMFLAAVDAGVPVRVTTRVMFESKDHLTAETLLAPLSEDGATVSMLFVCVGVWSDSRPPPEVPAS
jgi:hypothetical protein